MGSLIWFVVMTQSEEGADGLSDMDWLVATIGGVDGWLRWFAGGFDWWRRWMASMVDWGLRHRGH